MSLPREKLPQTGLLKLQPHQVDQSNALTSTACMSLVRDMLKRGISCREMRSLPLTVTIICDNCGKVFTKLRYEIVKTAKRGHNDLYCGLPCSMAHHAVKNCRRCTICNKPVSIKTREHCDDCREKLLKEKEKSKASPKTIICPQCGKTALKIHYHQIYCARECADIAHSKRMIGTGNPHYKDGKSLAKWFDEMRPVILKRDKYSCMGCGAPEAFTTRGKRQIQTSTIVIHHINEDTTNNHPQNLVALCQPCHGIHHKSCVTPYPKLAQYAGKASKSMTSKLKELATSLAQTYSCTTASS